MPELLVSSLRMSTYGCGKACASMDAEFVAEGAPGSLGAKAKSMEYVIIITDRAQRGVEHTITEIYS